MANVPITKSLLIAQVAVSGIALAQAPGAGDAGADSAWLEVPFVERESRFAQEDRDPDWAPAMEQRIAEAVAGFDTPLVELVGAQCRETLCRIEIHWPRSPSMPAMGIELTDLYGLGIDHQGESSGREDGNRYLQVLIARRR